VVDTENYLLKCYRYIELNPVAANMVTSPEEYKWTSYGCNAWGDKSDIVTAHSEYLSLGNTSNKRLYAYRSLFLFLLADKDTVLIRKSAHYCQPLGDHRFRAQIEKKLGPPVGQMHRGRPRKIDAVI
jgi:putative transposase